MNSRVRVLVALSALVTTGLLAGFFYAYTSSVNPGLGDLDDRAYVGAMQSINEAVPNGIFVIGFVGAPLLLLVSTVLHDGSPRRTPLLLATALVVGGGLLVTFFANVPLNDELAAVDLNGSQRALTQARADYEDVWNTWNTVRTVACTAAIACVGWALRLPDRTEARQPKTR